MARERALVVLMLTTRDEADVLKQNLEHHLAEGIDHVGVCDNRSRDDTQEVIRSFGDSVSSLVFEDFSRRQAFRMRCLERVAERLGRRPDWIGVADTDEFFWAPQANLPELLADVPPDVVAATSRQKLFVPTEEDAETGPVYGRMCHRTAKDDSPFHHGHREGKTFYRGAWLRRITSEHRSHEVPHPEWRFPVALVHHYMVRDADHFVKKVRRLSAWREHSWLQGSALFDRGYRAIMRRPQTPFVAGFKREWWRVLQQGGEQGLRSYYQEHVQVSRSRLRSALQAGHLACDAAFADFKSQRSRTGVPIGGSDSCRSGPRQVGPS